jgi:histidine ammonia-lyase
LSFQFVNFTHLFFFCLTCSLQAKEGLSLINGTQFITGVGIEAVAKARNLSRTADYVAALTTSALRGMVECQTVDCVME